LTTTVSNQYITICIDYTKWNIVISHSNLKNIQITDSFIFNDHTFKTIYMERWVLSLSQIFKEQMLQLRGTDQLSLFDSRSSCIHGNNEQKWKIYQQWRLAFLYDSWSNLINKNNSVSDPDPDPHGSVLKMTSWIRIRIRIRDADSRSGSRSFKITEKWKKLNIFLKISLTYCEGL